MPNNQSLKVNPAKSPAAAKAKQDGAKALLDHFLQYIKPKYLSGQNAVARTQTSHGFNVTKNAALNLGKLFGKDYDPRLRIRPNDPMTQQRQLVERIGLSERIYNNYYNPRVKLAD
jgi:hypothetical protein